MLVLLLVLALAATASAVPLVRREVPQEHSHDMIVNAVRKIMKDGNSNNPVAKIDPIFGTLGNKVAQGKIDKSNGLSQAQKDVACLQQNMADVCLDIAKANGNRDQVVACMQFRVLERNTNGAGLEQDVCGKNPKNEEIAGLTQIQDPASDLGISGNAKIQVDLAKNLMKLGSSADEAADLSLRTSTFAPGDKNKSAKANSCDENPVTADKAGNFFGLEIKKGDKIDCITRATLANGKSKAVPSISKEDLLAQLGGSGGGNGGNASNKSNKNKGKGKGKKNKNKGNNFASVTPVM